MPNFMHKLGSLVSKEADAATGKGNQKSASSKPSGKQDEKSELDKMIEKAVSGLKGASKKRGDRKQE
jgi:hypothetical protein